MSIGIKITGLDRVAAKFGRLRADMAAIEQKAIRNAIVPLKAAIQGAAPVGKTGKLRQAVRSRTRISQNRGIAIGNVVVSGKVAPHNWIVELGNIKTRPRRTATGKSTGNMPANPFVERTFSAMRSRVMSDVRAGILEGIEG